jgi:hypothetical protein
MYYAFKREISPDFMMQCTSLSKSTPQLSEILGCYMNVVADKLGIATLE